VHAPACHSLQGEDRCLERRAIVLAQGTVEQQAEPGFLGELGRLMKTALRVVVPRQQVRHSPVDGPIAQLRSLRFAGKGPGDGAGNSAGLGAQLIGSIPPRLLGAPEQLGKRGGGGNRYPR
jgi:hypothetical protein